MQYAIVDFAKNVDSLPHTMAIGKHDPSCHISAQACDFISVAPKLSLVPLIKIMIKHHMTCAVMRTSQGSTIGQPQIKERPLLAVCTSLND